MNFTRGSSSLYFMFSIPQYILYLRSYPLSNKYFLKGRRQLLIPLFPEYRRIMSSLLGINLLTRVKIGNIVFFSAFFNLTLESIYYFNFKNFSIDKINHLKSEPYSYNHRQHFLYVYHVCHGLPLFYKFLYIYSRVQH